MNNSTQAPLHGMPISIDMPVPLAVSQDEHVLFNLLSPILIVGRRGCGRTMFLEGATASALSCENTLVMHVSLDGPSGLTWPFMAPWIEDPVGERPIAGMAYTDREAKELVGMLIRIAGSRVIRAHRWAAAGRGEKVPASVNGPAIVLVVDGFEMASTELTQALLELLKTAGGTRINVVLGTQRVTADVIPDEMLELFGQRVCGRVSEKKDLERLFRAGDLLDPHTPQAGSGYFAPNPGGQVIEVSWPLFTPNRIAGLVVARYGIGPVVLGSADTAAAGEAYHSLWESADTWLRPNLRGEGTGRPVWPAMDRDCVTVETVVTINGEVFKRSQKLFTDSDPRREASRMVKAAADDLAHEVHPGAAAKATAAAGSYLDRVGGNMAARRSVRNLLRIEGSETTVEIRKHLVKEGFMKEDGRRQMVFDVINAEVQAGYIEQARDFGRWKATHKKDDPADA
jgi:hypothetical protein